MVQAKALCAVLGCATIHFAMGLYFSFGSNAVYMISYLRFNSASQASLEQNIWFFAAVGLSAILLPVGGLFHQWIGLRATCTLAGILQTTGILLTYYTLDHSFIMVVISYGGSFMFSCGLAYTSPLVNCTLWLPHKKGLATGFVCAAMALAPILWNPMLARFINPDNIAVEKDGYFYDPVVLQNTKDSMILQGCITFCLFTMGILLLFPAPNSEPKFNHLSSSKRSQRLNVDVASEPMDMAKPIIVGLSPRFSVKTPEFWLLSFKIMITELIFYYLLFVYKPFGQTFISNDFFLSTIGASSALANTVCRLIVGHLKDMFTYKNCCIPLSSLSTILIMCIPFTSHMPPLVYAVIMICSIGLVGSQYALMPNAVAEAFGERYASINIGLVYMSTVIADIIGGLGSQYLTQYMGWKGMLQIIACCSLIDLVVSWWLPSNQSERLNERLLKQNLNCLIRTNQQAQSKVNTIKPVDVVTCIASSALASSCNDRPVLVLDQPHLQLVGCPNCCCTVCQQTCLQQIKRFAGESTHM